jgi:hypothetical protein
MTQVSDAAPGPLVFIWGEGSVNTPINKQNKFFLYLDLNMYFET